MELRTAWFGLSPVSCWCWRKTTPNTGSQHSSCDWSNAVWKHIIRHSSFINVQGDRSCCTTLDYVKLALVSLGT